MDQKKFNAGTNQNWNHSSHDSFFNYYAEQSLSEITLHRFLTTREKILGLMDLSKRQQCLQVADIGCGVGTQSFLWAELGYQVFGIDINERFIDLARERSSKMPGEVKFYVGSATKLPWPDQSIDICLVPELLEHVADWRCCLNEFIRILKPGGILYISTTNKLCPIQEEFNLPLYSWYPAFIKRYFEKMVVTKYPHLANYATYPAVNWFSFYSLRRVLVPYKFDCLDRFDNRWHVNASEKKKIFLNLIRFIPLLQFVGHVLTPYTVIIALKPV